MITRDEVRRDDQTVRAGGHWRRRAVGLAVIGLAILAAWIAVLRFVHPGFVDPFWPNHSDAYLILANLHGARSIADVLAGPRPASILLLSLMGLGGFHAMMAGFHAMVFFNVAAVALLARKVFGTTGAVAGPMAVFAFAFIVFAHPHQYTFSTYDVTAQASFLFLIAGALLAAYRAPVWRVFACLLLGCLAKETFYASLLFVCCTWVLFAPSADRAYARSIAIAAFCAAIVGLVDGQLSKSIFTGAQNSAGAPYQIDVSPAAVFGEWLKYAREGLRPGDAAVLVLALAAVGLAGGRKGFLVASAAVVAGALAWLPNAIFPNHYFPGYAWQAAYGLYFPLLGLAAAITPPTWARWGAGVALIGALVAPVLDAGRFSAAGWVNEQQARQHRLIEAIERDMRALPPGTRRIMVSGLNFPFSPFDHPASLRAFGLPENVTMEVITYMPRTGEGETPDLLRHVAPEALAPGRFDAVWLFGSDGAGIDPALATDALAAVFGVPREALLRYPDMIPISAAVQGKPMGADWLRCGGALASYNELRLSEMCLRASIRDLTPNPYAHFYLGDVLEKAGRLQEARASFVKAVAEDDKAHPNAAFAAGVARTAP